MTVSGEAGTAAPTRTAAAPVAPFTTSTPERIGYGSGALATGVFATVPGLVLLYYMTDVLGVAAGIASLVVFVPKLLDLFYNPAVGRLSDRTRSALGPRRPWLILGAVTFPLAFVAIFLSPFSGVAAALWVAVALSVAGLAFSFFVVPYAVVPAEIVDSTRERTSLMSWRMCFLGLAILASGGLAPLLVESAGGDAAGYRVMAVAMGGVALVGTLGAIYGTRRSTAANAGTSAYGSLGTAVRAGMRSRQFRSLFLAFLALETAAALALAGMPYLADHVIGDPESMVVLFLCLITPLMLTMPVWRIAAIRFGKRAALLAATAVFAAGEAGLFVLPLVPADARLLVASATVAVAGIGFAGVQMLPQAMLGDTLSYDASTGAERRAGLLTGLWTAGETVAMALGAGVFGVLLAVTGFVSSTADAQFTAQQPAAALWGIVAGAGAVPVACLGLAAWALSRFSLTEAEVDRLVGSTPDN